VVLFILFGVLNPTGYGDYGGYPYGGYYDPGSPPPYAYCSYADYKSNVASYGDCYPFGY
jgi:hypothetical protein